ncbi:uncharacterized protein CDV56_102291 [Aspergillus thermomutatus]|uniref:Uncharacterized protein n=1 Tax=Aspergillus thermomutatus TaxID=41047 RepID=A0A397G6V0_ASPTH|nr:uncharacterized protein CDV56_102291 [Aspergillus thermomutatus]RHZ43840.1 hypothetical protein CDV56_102291 [Aspergillus thermomutatus]
MPFLVNVVTSMSRNKGMYKSAVTIMRKPSFANLDQMLLTYSGSPLIMSSGSIQLAMMTSPRLSASSMSIFLSFFVTLYILMFESEHRSKIKPMVEKQSVHVSMFNPGRVDSQGGDRRRLRVHQGYFPLWGLASNKLGVLDKRLVDWAVSRRCIITDRISYYVYCRNIASWSQMESINAVCELLETTATDTNAAVSYTKALIKFYRCCPGTRTCASPRASASTSEDPSTCAMCSKEMQPEVNLCAEGTRGNICIIKPMNQNQIAFSVNISKPRGGSRTYINVKPFITVVTRMDVCDSWQKNGQSASDEHENGFRGVVTASKTYPTLSDPVRTRANPHVHILPEEGGVADGRDDLQDRHRVLLQAIATNKFARMLALILGTGLYPEITEEEMKYITASELGHVADLLDIRDAFPYSDRYYNPINNVDPTMHTFRRLVNDGMHKDLYALMFANRLILWIVCPQRNMEEMMEVMNKAMPTHGLYDVPEEFDDIFGASIGWLGINASPSYETRVYLFDQPLFRRRMRDEQRSTRRTTADSGMLTYLSTTAPRGTLRFNYAVMPDIEELNKRRRGIRYTTNSTIEDIFGDRIIHGPHRLDHADESLAHNTIINTYICINMDFKRNETMHMICIWCEKVSTHSDLDLKRMNDMNMKPNKKMINVGTIIMACTSCMNDLKLNHMPRDELMKMEMNLYKRMVERTLAISSSVWCTNENMYATM